MGRGFSSASDFGGSATTTSDAYDEVGSYSSYDNPSDSSGPSKGEQKRKLEAFKKKQAAKKAAEAKAAATAKEEKRFEGVKKKSGDRAKTSKAHDKVIAANKAEAKQKGTVGGKKRSSKSKGQEQVTVTNDKGFTATYNKGDTTQRDAMEAAGYYSNDRSSFRDTGDKQGKQSLSEFGSNVVDAYQNVGRGGVQGVVGGVGDLVDLAVDTANAVSGDGFDAYGKSGFGQKGREITSDALTSVFGEADETGKKAATDLGDFLGSAAGGGGGGGKVGKGLSNLIGTTSKTKNAAKTGFGVAKDTKKPANTGAANATNSSTQSKTASKPASNSVSNSPTTGNATNKTAKTADAKVTATPKFDKKPTPTPTKKKSGEDGSTIPAQVGKVVGATNAATSSTGTPVSSGEGDGGPNSGGRTVEGPEGPAKDPKAPVASGEGGGNNKGLIKTQDELSATEASALNKRRRAKVTPSGAKSKLGTGGGRSPLSKLGGKQTKLKGSKGKDQKSTQQSTLLSVGDYFSNRANKGAGGGTIGL